MKKKLLILILLAPLLSGMVPTDGVKSGKPGDAGYIDITVESNVNRIFFKYNINEWCLSVPGASKTSIGSDTSVSLIRVPVKDFKSTSLFVYRDFLALLKADEFPYLEIAVPQSPGTVHNTDGSYILKGVSVTVAGVTNKYDILCHIEKDDNQSRLLSGTLRIKLTDLEIDPPVKLSGLVKVRNEIIVKFGFCIRNTGTVTA